ncbi:unnamed protein product, partial [Rotaria magnacalcarata]
LDLTNSSISTKDLVGGPILSGSTLDVFIRTQLKIRGGTIDTGRELTKFSLVDPIVLVDEFDTWYFDHLHGLFELNLVPIENTFPHKWKLTPDTKLFYVFEFADDIRSTNQDDAQRPMSIDRPRTVSLQCFVADVCEKENNGMTQDWTKALRADHLFTYDHLANLKFTEWDQLKELPLNGRKILKSYVDREKQMASDIKTSGKESKTKSSNDIREEFSKAGVQSPAKLDAECVQLSFDEMRREGFADDGLFDQMKLFFLPLTMVEEDLTINKKVWKSISKSLSTERNTLMGKKQELSIQLNEKLDEYYRHDDAIRNLRLNPQSTTQRSAEARREEYETFSTTELIQEHRLAMQKFEPIRENLQKQIETIDDLINSINQSFSEENINSGTKFDRDLIKPNRGFIMYGPPGTGKSDIMSKLSVRMGISMVAPPLAAGELNRPLVGESERIISDICMRCHRIPYLMCCVSIDEIDSLAPKRKDGTSDGNVAKLSVLLSVIDGIKDVPNLMIFCATNRLHMMDDAFLRRMSGKFFVGRPSSHARKSILSGIKPWHMPPNLLDGLTTATTNFSGAALRSLRRLITVYCHNAQTTNPSYVLEYRTLLELTDITARHFRILLGAETLPTILLRSIDRQQLNGNDQQSQEQFYDLPNQAYSVYTGKILIDMHAGCASIEAMYTHPTTGEQKKIVYQHNLLPTETSLQGLLERLTVYGKSRNVQLLQLIDLNLLTAESAYDEKQKFETLKERLDECAAYRRSMTVYDLDSLIGINRSEGNASTGRTTNLSLINHNMYTHVKDKFQHTYVQTVSGSVNDKNVNSDEKWSVMVISEPFLLRQFYDDVKFTRSDHEIELEKNENRRATERVKCVQCTDYYIEKDNHMGICVHHDGFIYDNHSTNMKIYTPREAIAQLLKEDAQPIQQHTRYVQPPEDKERVERMKQRFKFICCNQTLVTGGMMGGCKRGTHSEPHVTFVEWEMACKNNKDYREKRISLLQSRTGFD